jgi:putative ABC transport system permease protein
LLGLTAFTTQQRQKEISIRRVLGASTIEMVKMITKNYLWLALIAAVIAFPIAWYFMNKWLENFAYKVHLGWIIFFIAGTVAVLIALLTVSYQAIKAAIANPVKSLRTE